MDFKIAGTEEGITAMQLDVKLPGIPMDILIEAMSAAKRARSFVLKRMALVLASPRTDVQHQVDGLVQQSIKFTVPLRP
jgi:polyribonucleotide nucleotidyltransferase